MKTGIMKWLMDLFHGQRNGGPATPSASQEDPSTEAGPPKQTILVVDDDPITIKLMSAKLQSAGYRVVSAADGSAAITAIRDEQPAMVLLDVNFPPDVPNGGKNDWNGYQLMMWLRSATSLHPSRFVMITAGVSAELEAQIRNSGVGGLFHKPVEFSALLALIQQQLPAPAQTNRSAAPSPEPAPQRGSSPAQTPAAEVPAWRGRPRPKLEPATSPAGRQTKDDGFSVQA